MVLLLVAGLGLATGAVWASVRSAWVVPETANLRKSPSTSADLVTQVSKGGKVFATKFNNGWAYVKTSGGKWGWIREDLLQFSAAKAQALTGGAASSSSSGHPTVWVSVSNANVRSGPGLGYGRYGALDAGTKLYLLERRGDWLLCKTPHGSGWISSSVVSTSHAGHASAAPSSSSPTKAFVDGEVVNLRESPTTAANLVARLRQGQTLWIMEKRPNWALVHVEGGAIGWVARDYLKAPGSAPVAPPNFPSTSGGGHFRTLTAWVDEEPCNVHSGPSVDSDVSFQLKKNERLTVTALDGNWCKIKADNGDTGWVAGWVIDFTPPGQDITRTENGQETEVKMGWVARPAINLRSGAGENYPRTGTLALSTQVYIVGRKGDWYKVALDNREIGWVGSWLIETRSQRATQSGGGGGGPAGSCPPSVESVPSAGSDQGGGDFGQSLVHTAMKQLGDNYVRGGESPGGFDCSGLVCYVLGQHGVSAERTSQAMFRQGTPVSRDQLSPGDVVFFKNTYRAGISHVGMYIGSGKFIHAANPGSGVKITGLDESYYAGRYVGARRMH
jgi:uncharacterized protein YgiM (DUF1202 family)